jgi:hypothetical protein
VCVGNLIRVVAVCAIGLTVALFTPLTAKSDIITYGDFSGADAVFRAVTESAAEPLASGGFGAPVVSANTLVFTPNAFAAASAGGTPDIIDRQLTMTIAAVANQVIQKVTFSEAGDYTLVGPGSTITRAHVATPGYLTITKVNGLAITPIEIAGSGTFSPAGGLYPLSGSGVTGVQWSGDLQFDLTAALRAKGINGFATEATLSLDNTLVAQSEATTIAHIAKKTAQVTVDPQATPEPGTLVLLGLGAVSLVGFQWRRRKSVQNAA